MNETTSSARVEHDRQLRGVVVVVESRLPELDAEPGGFGRELGCIRGDRLLVHDLLVQAEEVRAERPWGQRSRLRI